MGWTASPVTIVVFGSAAVAMVVGLIALWKRPDPLAWPLAVTMFAVAAWALPHAIGLGFTDAARVVRWNQIRYLGTVVAPVAYLVLSLKYAGYEHRLSRRAYAALGAIPAVTVVAVWTNSYHGLFWRSLSVANVGGASVLVSEFGPWYWVNLGYLYVVTAASLLLLGSVAVRAGLLYRKQATLMFVGGLIPFATNAAINFGPVPSPTVDLTTTALAATGVTFTLALFHFDLLEIRPVARERLVERLDDGVVVVGPDGRIRDFNPTAARVLGDVSVDQPADEVLPSDVVADGGELVVEMDGEKRRFRTRATELTDERNREIGRIVYLNDITELIEREQRISVLNRILRHNVRNELNVAIGHLSMIEDRTSGVEREHVRTAEESIDRVVELAERARHVEQTLRTGETAVVVSAATVADRVVADARERHPDAVIDYELTDGADADAAVRVVDGDLFELALAELVDNGVVHNHREMPRVTVRVDPTGERVRVTIADNGPGIPEQETDVLDSRIETQVEHGSGLGLWLVMWTASLSAGDLSFSENEPHGSVVTLSLPSAEE